MAYSNLKQQNMVELEGRATKKASPYFVTLRKALLSAQPSCRYLHEWNAGKAGMRVSHHHHNCLYAGLPPVHGVFHNTFLLRLARSELYRGNKPDLGERDHRKDEGRGAKLTTKKPLDRDGDGAY